MRKIALILIMCAFAIPVLVSQTALDSFNDSLSSALGEVNSALPDAAVVGGTWSDSYIGQFVDTPPHFGIGISAGASRFPIGDLNDAIEITGGELPTDTLILPNFAIEARIGGFALPFDIGFRFGMIPETEIQDVSIKYINYGVDVRYAVLEEGAAKPDLIVGLGYYHTNGNIGYTFDTGSLPVGIPASYQTQEQDLDLAFSTNVFEAKVQLSKKLLIITPYIGLGGYMAKSDSTYEVANQDGSEKETVFGARVYGGLSFNILLLKLDLSGMYNFMSGNWGFNFGPRIQF